MEPLSERPAVLASPDVRPLLGLWRGGLDDDPRAGGRRGRTRRWSYSAAGTEQVMVGAAIVDLGYAGTSFAWAFADGTLATWQARGVPRLQAHVGATGSSPARFVMRGGHVRIHHDGCLDVDVPLEAGRRLRARTTLSPDEPATLLTPTHAGGWNATQKVAGEAAHVVVAVGEDRHEVEGGAWRDWTLGAQDRRTSWRWAAGAGHSDDGLRVGINASTGMNEHGAGEDVVWWDGVPHPLDVEALGPVGASLEGPWRLAGPDWELRFRTLACRSADERFVVVRSRYVQPIGVFEGRLPHPDGRPRTVRLAGVTEDHEARW